MKKNFLSVVIITCNRKNELRKTIDSCTKFVGMPHEIIVVDNGSTDGTREMLMELAMQNNSIKPCFQEKNLGVAGGRNKGFEVSNSDTVFFIDDDAYFDDESVKLSEAYHYMQDNIDVGALAFDIYDLKQKRKLIDEKSKYNSSEVISYIGAAHMIRKIPELKGRLYPQYLHYGAEERYATLKLKDMGYKVVLLEKVRVIHNPSVNTRTSQYNIHRNVKINQMVIKNMLYPLIAYIVSYILFLLRLIKLEKGNVSKILEAMKIENEREIENKEATYKIKYNTLFELIKNYGIKNII